MTNEEILRFRNVPIRVAAEYLGVTQKYIRFGIIQGTLPIGSYVQVGENRREYHVCPKALIAYANGEK